MDKILLFKSTLKENHEDIPKNNIFGFKINGPQISVFSTKGALPHVHMIGYAIKMSGLLDQYARKHPTSMEKNYGQTGHAYYKLFHFPIVAARRDYYCGTFESVGVKKKSAEFEVNSSGKIAPEAVDKNFYLNDFIDFILQGMRDFCPEIKFEVKNIELKKQEMISPASEDQMNWFFNELIYNVEQTEEIVLYTDNEKYAENIKKEISARIEKDGAITINQAFFCKNVSRIGRDYEFQFKYHSYGWDEDVIINIEEKRENAWKVILSKPKKIKMVECDDSW